MMRKEKPVRFVFRDHMIALELWGTAIVSGTRQLRWVRHPETGQDLPGFVDPLRNWEGYEIVLYTHPRVVEEFRRLESLLWEREE